MDPEQILCFFWPGFQRVCPTGASSIQLGHPTPWVLSVGHLQPQHPWHRWCHHSDAKRCECIPEKSNN